MRAPADSEAALTNLIENADVAKAQPKAAQKAAPKDATNAATKAAHPPAPVRRRTARHGAIALDAQEEMRVLHALRAQLEVHHEALDDPDLMLILAEGETSLLELLDLMLEADMSDEGLIKSLKLTKDTLAVRLHRFEERRQSRRSIIEQALMLLECKSLERPTGTLTLSDRAPSLIVEEEAQIPARFFDLKPALNRRLLKEALTAGEEVAGAKLSNGMLTLTVRRR